MKKTVLVTVIASAITAPSFAENNFNPFTDEKSGFYLGLGAGKSSYDDSYSNSKGKLNTSLKSHGGLPHNSSISESNGESIGKLFFGYRINKYLAIELDYNDLNTAEARFKGERSYNGDIHKNLKSKLSGRITDEIRGIGIKAVGLYPVTKQFDLKASFGAMKWEVKEKTFGSYIYDEEVEDLDTGDITKGTDTKFINKNISKKGTSLTLGLGANYNITDNVAIGLQWERIKDIGHKKLAFGETDIDTYTLSAQYNF